MQIPGQTSCAAGTFMLVTADQIMYQKEHPDENLKKINKFHKKICL